MIGPGAGLRKGFYDPYTNYGHYSRLEADGSSDWHPSFLQLAPTLTGCAKRYQRFCQNYRSKSKPVKIRQWGNKLIAVLKSTATKTQGKSKRHRHCIGQQSLPINLPMLQQLPEHWQQIAEQFRHCNAPRWNDSDLPMLQQLPEHWQQIAEQFRHCNAPRWNDSDRFDSS